MTESQKLQQEIDSLNKKRELVKKETAIECDFPQLSRTYTYRKSISIRSL
tara:strand:- start:2093 stop:2242 length:150 start_codon:yes stop_codon:yes gene_type:complete